MDYVQAVFAKTVRVVCSISSMRAALEAAGATMVSGSLEYSFSSKHELASVLSRLQALGLLFGNEPAGWSPAAVFHQLREEGLVKGRIKNISWRSPKDPVYGES